MCNPALAVVAASTIVAASSARNAAKLQQQSLLTDANAADRQAQVSESQAQVADNNAQLAEWQAQDALRRSEVAASDQAVATGNLKSRQKAALGASGTDVTTGTANDILTGTDLVGQAQVDTIRDNAMRDAWGYRTQGTSYSDTAAARRSDAALYGYDAQRLRSGASNINPNKAALVSLIGSAGNVASSWYASKGT